jgi:hypothetical protein
MKRKVYRCFADAYKDQVIPKGEEKNRLNMRTEITVENYNIRNYLIIRGKTYSVN